MAKPIIACLFFLFPFLTHAQALPDMPVPKPEAFAFASQRDRAQRFSDRPFYDRQAKIELAANLTLLGLDSGFTCHNLATGGREGILPTQRCAPAVALMSAGLVAQELASYWLYRAGHHRLAHLLRFVTLEEHARGVWTYRNGFAGHGCSRFGRDFWWNGQTCTNAIH